MNIPSAEEDLQKYITFLSLATNESWKMDARLYHFSEFLQHMEPNAADQLLTVQLEAFLQVDQKIINLIAKFYQMHGYSSERIKITKIKTTGWVNSLDTTTLSYVNTHLKEESEQLLKRLLRVCGYLRLKHLQQAICVFIASKHYFNYNNHMMIKALEESGIFYSRQMEINLKRAMLGYAQQFGKDILEIIKHKAEARNQQQPRQ